MLRLSGKRCVAARGYAHPHGLVPRDEGDLPLVSIDYIFLGEREEPGCLANLAVKDLSTKCVFSCSVPKKGEDLYVVDRVCRFLDSLGYKRVRLRSDQEPAILALLKAVKDTWSGEILPENIRHEVLTAIASLEIVCFVTRGKRSFTEAEHNFVFEVIAELV